MLAAHLTPLAASLFSLLAILCLVISFVMLGSRWLKDYLYAFAAQSWLIALLSATIGYYGGYRELYAIAVLTALFRGLILPWLVLKILHHYKVERELRPILQASTSLLLGAVIVVFALVIAFHITGALDLSQNVVVLALTVMLSMKLIGFLILSLRQEAISQILAIMLLENGIFLGSQILVPGMPMLVELVLLFDLLVAVVCFGVLVRYLIAHVGSTSSHELQRLKG